jgi:hypothetical protein
MRFAENLTEILNHHLAGGKFTYPSYDHNKAAEEFKQTQEYADLSELNRMFGGIGKLDKYMIPPEIRAKHGIRRNGKLRSIYFDNNGQLFRVKIGARYSISFYNSSAFQIELL